MCSRNAVEDVPACASKMLLDGMIAKFGTGNVLYAKGSPCILDGAFRATHALMREVRAKAGDNALKAGKGTLRRQDNPALAASHCTATRERVSQ